MHAAKRDVLRNRWRTFKANRRGYISAMILATLFGLSIFSEVIANDKPIFAVYKGKWLLPFAVSYAENETFGGPLESEADYSDPWTLQQIEDHGFAIWPPVRFSYRSINFNIERAPSPPSTSNLLGTDDQGRDVLARALYGLRTSMCFALLLVSISSVIGVSLGALQGYYGGLVDLFMQRFIEMWHGVPVLFLLIILSSIVVPSFGWILALMLCFSWMSLVDLTRAECLRVRNFDYVRAAKALGAREHLILFRHVLPSALVSVFTYVPFLVVGAITTLASLDFLGFGLPSGSASLGELLQQGKNNPQSPWLGMIGFFVLALVLSLCLFMGEAVRDAFDPRKLQRGARA